MVLDKARKQLAVLSNVYNDPDGEISLAGDFDDRLAIVTIDDGDQWPEIQSSSFARNTTNSIRRIVDVLSVEPNPAKALLKLQIGDPSVTGVLPTHPATNAAVVETLASARYNGYGPAIGFPEVRKSLAEYIGTTRSDSRLTADDIILTSGCSHGLQLAIEALANPGMNILVPRPGFPLYETLMRPLGVEPRHYDLLANQEWRIDLRQMEHLIDGRTAAMVINNPSNPTGAVYGKEHLEEILRVAQSRHVPIIADEIYGDMVYGGAQFHAMHTLEPKVPMLTCDGISKRYLVPGWRLGWLIVHDVDGAFAHLRLALHQLAQKIVGPCALMQGALPLVLNRTPDDFFQNTRTILERNAKIVYDRLSGVGGISPIRSRGAMYLMINIDLGSFPSFNGSDLDFVQALIREESLYCLPGSAFYYPGAIRLVIAHSAENMTEACERLKSFCTRYYQPTFSPVYRTKAISCESKKCQRNASGH